MKKFFWIFGSVLLAISGSAGVLAFRYVPVIKPNVFVGSIPVGGLTKEEASKKIRIWWETEKLRIVRASVGSESGKTLDLQISKLGKKPDDSSSVDSLPLDTWVESTSRSIQGEESPRQSFALIFTTVAPISKDIAEFVKSSIGDPRPARVRFVEGAIQREPEVSGYEIDSEQLQNVLAEVSLGDGTLQIPIRESAKSIPNEVLEQMTEVIGEYTTKYPVSQTSRNTNIRTAASKIDGTILLPGQTFSFNGIVGERTVKNGYKLAGVYRAGRHDVGIGGGICQVSGTLYNAALLANLKIEQRLNHSMPVPYLPVGQDATVNWGTVDFRFSNTYDRPVALSAEMKGGKFTFRVIGQKKPGLEVKITRAGHSSWGRGIQYVHDGTLPAGKTKVVDKGGSGHRITVYRDIYQDGKLLKREPLGTSHYSGGPKIVAKNMKVTAAEESPDDESGND